MARALSIHEVSEIALPCPECGNDVVFKLSRVVLLPHHIAGEWGVCNWERDCGCQLDDFPDTPEGQQPIDHLIRQAIDKAERN